MKIKKIQFFTAKSRSNDRAKFTNVEKNWKFEKKKSNITVRVLSENSKKCWKYSHWTIWRIDFFFAKYYKNTLKILKMQKKNKNQHRKQCSW